MAKEPVSVRKRLSIPRVDESTLEWWDLQQDAGVSIRMLIRAEIQRNGMTDVVNAPVTQGPRRGRPPLEADSVPSPAVPPSAAIEADAVMTDRGDESDSNSGQTRVLEVVSARPLPVPTASPESSGVSVIDSIMNS